MTAVEEDGTTAVSAAPRPRSLYEGTWDEAVVDLLPSPEDGMPGMSPAPAVPRPWAVGTHPDVPSAVGDVPVGPALPSAQGPVPVTPQPYPPYAPVDDGEQPRDRVPQAPRPAARPHTGRPLGPAGTDEEIMTHAVPLSPVPGTPPVAPSPPPVPVPSPTAPPGIGEGPVPPRTVAAPVEDAAIAEAGTAPELVRAEPAPVVPDAMAPPAGPATESVPVVVEIERVEVRVVADTPSGPARERRPRPRTGPTLDEYLGSAAGRGTS
ncbi:hypothetical protein RKD23_007595 [Streptomyces sp. SAI-170]|uniref:hypothetical protein n=1 Tax=Streptomyces sp. SAI-170 TaxID=3377729 RepID=UPI003C7EC4C4